MFNYPIFLNLSNQTCLVVGAGPVGCRKALSLLKAGAGQVKMVAPASPSLPSLQSPPSLQLSPSLQQQPLQSSPPMPSNLENELQNFAAFVRIEREFQETDLDDCQLVFAATSKPELNEQIALLCKKKKCLCNVASSLEQSQFILPALLQQNQISVAVSTNGVSPSLAQQIRNSLAACIQPQHQVQINFLSKLRPLILELGLPSHINKNIFELLAVAPLEAFLENNKVVSEYLNLHLPAHLSLKCREKIVEIVANNLENT